MTETNHWKITFIKDYFIQYIQFCTLLLNTPYYYITSFAFYIIHYIYQGL